MSDQSTKLQQKNRLQEQAQEQKSQPSFVSEVRKDGLAAEVPAGPMRVQTNIPISRHISFRLVWLLVYLFVLLLPIYWMFNMSLRDNNDIMSRMAFFPDNPVIHNYVEILTDPAWYWGYINSFAYVSINTVICLVVALPAAYAFSRYRFLGDKHLFFWLLTNRMAPAAVFLLPVFQLYSALGLIDTYIAVALAHTLFNVPLAVWILEGFMSGVPREIDETAFIDGYSLPRFFLAVFIPLIRAGVGVTAFFCFMFSWVELLFARTLTVTNAKPIAVVMTRTVSASGLDWGLLAAAGILTIVPGALVIYFVRNYIAKGFALGRV
jgi:glycerol transport system permease protein